MKGQYRPTVEDFNPRNAQQLSCRAGGEFDKKFITMKDGKVVNRKPTTNWTLVCQRRQAAKRTAAEVQQ